MENVKKIYKAFNQQGGTIHQLREKLSKAIKQDKCLEAVVIDGYFEYLFNCKHEKLLNIELSILEARVNLN